MPILIRHRNLFYQTKSKHYAQITNLDDRLIKPSPNCILLTLETCSWFGLDCGLDFGLNL